MTALGHKNVGWLNIAVDDLLGVRGIESVGDLDAKRQHVFDVERFPRNAVLQG